MSVVRRKCTYEGCESTYSPYLGNRCRKHQLTLQEKEKLRKGSSKCTFLNCKSTFGVFIGQRCRKHRLSDIEQDKIRRERYKNRRVFFKCKCCGKEASVLKSRLDESATRGTYCSFQCRKKDTYGKTIQRNCAWCKKEFSERPSRVAVGRGVYCSKECQYAAQRLKLGPEAPRWKGIKIHLNRIRCSGASKRWKKLIRQRKRCEICNDTENLHAHHVRALLDLFLERVKGDVNGHYDPNDTFFHQESNGLLVCSNCHADLHPHVTILQQCRK